MVTLVTLNESVCVKEYLRDVCRLFMILDLYFPVFMGKSSFRPRSMWRIVGILIVGGMFFLVQRQLPGRGIDPGTSSYRDKVAIHQTHQLVDRERTLRNRPYREEQFTSIRNIDLQQPLHQSGIRMIIPAFQGDLVVDAVIAVGPSILSGRLTLSGSFLISTGTLIVSGTDIFSGERFSRDSLLSVNITLDMIHKGAKSRWYLESFSVMQSGAVFDLPLVTQAYVKQYEKTWLSVDDTPAWIKEISSFSTFAVMNTQTDQHIVITNSGTVNLLVKGADRTLDAEIDKTGAVSATMTFPAYSLLMKLREDKETDSYSCTLYKPSDSSEPFLSGLMRVFPKQKSLMTSGNRSGQRANTLVYSGEHTFTVRPLPVFSVTPLEQYRPFQW